MLATSLNNPVTMGKCIYKILELLEAGEEITSENLGYDIDEHKRVWLDYVAITKDNLEDAESFKIRIVGQSFLVDRYDTYGPRSLSRLFLRTVFRADVPAGPSGGCREGMTV